MTIKVGKYIFGDWIACSDKIFDLRVGFYRKELSHLMFGSAIYVGYNGKSNVWRISLGDNVKDLHNHQFFNKDFIGTDEQVKQEIDFYLYKISSLITFI